MPTADISRAAFGIMTAAPAERPATYQDVLDTPAHRVAEVRASPLHMQPRPASHHAWARSGLGAQISRHSTRGMVGPTSGGSSINRNCISARISWGLIGIPA